MFVAAEMILTTAATQYQLYAQKQLITKWKEGSLTLPELMRLKRSPWFRKIYYKNRLEALLGDKKDN